MAKKANVFFYDIESWPNLFMVTLKHKGTGKKKVWYVYSKGKYTDVQGNFGKLLNIFKSDAWMTGYNSKHFDDQIMCWILDNTHNIGDVWTEYDFTKAVHNIAQEIVEDEYKKYAYQDRFNSLDLMRIGAIDKSLKAVAINLKWPLILELPYGIDYHPEKDEIDEIIKYNINDVEITEALYYELQEDINLRSYLSSKYGINVMSYPDSGVCNKIFLKEYSKRSNTPKRMLRDMQTERWEIDFSDCISDRVRFQTPKMKDFLQKMEDTTIGVNESFSEHVVIGNTRYKVAQGGLHSEHEPGLIEATDDIILAEDDVSSYYPKIMTEENIKPEHLGDTFIKLTEQLTEERLSAKYTGIELAEQGRDEEAELAFTRSDGLKILINSIFGKLGYGNHWLYDPLAMYSVTLCGQLFLLMLIEKLEAYNFEVVYANTDGIVTKVPKDRRDEYEAVREAWQDYTNFVLDFEEFNKMIIRDVNNYIIQKADGSIKAKGALNKKRHKGSWGLSRSFDRPIIPIALEKYFLEGEPIEKTIKNHDDPLDFCLSHKASKKFDIKKRWIEDGQIKEEDIQRTNRYLITKSGCRVVKYTDKKELSVPKTKGQFVTLLNSDPESFNMDNINYRYYIQETRKISEQIDHRQMSMF